MVDSKQATYIHCLSLPTLPCSSGNSRTPQHVKTYRIQKAIRLGFQPAYVVSTTWAQLLTMDLTESCRRIPIPPNTRNLPASNFAGSPPTGTLGTSPTAGFSVSVCDPVFWRLNVDHLLSSLTDSLCHRCFYVTPRRQLDPPQPSLHRSSAYRFPARRFPRQWFRRRTGRKEAWECKGLVVGEYQSGCRAVFEEPRLRGEPSRIASLYSAHLPLQVDHFTKAFSEAELLEKLPNYSAVGIRSKTKMTAKVIKAASKVRTTLHCPPAVY